MLLEETLGLTAQHWENHGEHTDLTADLGIYIQW